MNDREDRRRYTRCSFCGKGQDQVRKLVAGPGVYICDQCIDLCQEVLEEDSRSAGSKKSKTGFIPNPKTIAAALDQYVIGQDHAKKVLSVQVYNHYKRISASKSVGDVELTKANVLLVGPTGCGKTYLAQTLAKILGVTDVLTSLQPQDMLKYGFIPEFIGRLPITVTLHPLDEEDIVRILTEPKNALVKQYQKFFALDNVDLVFEPTSLNAIAEKALGRGTGARALKSIIEEVLLNSMFEIPSRPDIKRCVISEKAIRELQEPEFEYTDESDQPPQIVGESA